MRVLVLTLEADGETTVEGAFVALPALARAVSDCWGPHDVPDADDLSAWQEETPDTLAYVSPLLGPGVVWRATRCDLEGVGDRGTRPDRDTTLDLFPSPEEELEASRAMTGDVTLCPGCACPLMRGERACPACSVE